VDGRESRSKKRAEHPQRRPGHRLKPSPHRENARGERDPDKCRKAEDATRCRDLREPAVRTCGKTLLDLGWLVLRSVRRDARRKVVWPVTKERPFADHLRRDPVEAESNVGRLLEARAARVVTCDYVRRFHGAQDASSKWRCDQDEPDHGSRPASAR